MDIIAIFWIPTDTYYRYLMDGFCGKTAQARFGLPFPLVQIMK